MILTLLGITMLGFIISDAYMVYKHGNKSLVLYQISRIRYKIAKTYKKHYIYYIMRHKIIMCDIDHQHIRDLTGKPLEDYLNKIKDIIHHTTSALVTRIDTYQTRKGRHLIIFLHHNTPLTTPNVIRILEILEVDEDYKRIFLERGYFSLFQIRRGRDNAHNYEVREWPDTNTSP